MTAALLSMDSTLRSNLSVGMPLDLAVIRKDAFTIEPLVRINEEDESFRELSGAWSNALRDSFGQMNGIVPPSWRAGEHEQTLLPLGGFMAPPPTATPAPVAAAAEEPPADAAETLAPQPGGQSQGFAPFAAADGVEGGVEDGAPDPTGSGA